MVAGTAGELKECGECVGLGRARVRVQCVLPAHLLRRDPEAQLPAMMRSAGPNPAPRASAALAPECARRRG